jgi:hypothetical protein
MLQSLTATSVGTIDELKDLRRGAEDIRDGASYVFRKDPPLLRHKSRQPHRHARKALERRQIEVHDFCHRAMGNNAYLLMGTALTTPIISHNQSAGFGFGGVAIYK